MIPPKRLKYIKWNNCDNVIIIDLHNGYSVIAIWGTENKTDFTVTLHLMENTIEQWDLIVDDWTFVAKEGTINAAILRTVADKLEEGFFDEFIRRSEYYVKCSDIGSEVLEQREKGDK